MTALRRKSMWPGGEKGGLPAGEGTREAAAEAAWLGWGRMWRGPRPARPVRSPWPPPRGRPSPRTEVLCLSNRGPRGCPLSVVKWHVDAVAGIGHLLSQGCGSRPPAEIRGRPPVWTPPKKQRPSPTWFSPSPSGEGGRLGGCCGNYV